MRIEGKRERERERKRERKTNNYYERFPTFINANQSKNWENEINE